MTSVDIPLDKAELLSVILEALLYGFSLLMCGGTIWTLLTQRTIHRLNRKMLSVACLLLLFSTGHLVVDIFRVMEGLVLYRDTYPGGPIGYFADISQWTFVSKCYLYVAQTLIGDGVVLYRCYVVWQSKLVMIFPALLYCTVAATGLMSSYTASKVTQAGVFVGALSRWITSFWATALVTNLLTTFLLVCRIWHVDRKTRKLCGHQKSHLRPMLHILLDAGVIYSLTLLVALVCFVIETNGQFVVLAMVAPIISITFYMVIIRVGIATRADYTTTTSFGNLTLDHSESAERQRRMQVRITTLTQSIVDERSLVPLANPISYQDRRTEVPFDAIGQAV